MPFAQVTTQKFGWLCVSTNNKQCLDDILDIKTRHELKSVTFGSIELTWCFIFQVPTFRSRLRCSLLSCTEHCQLALGRIVVTKLLHGSKHADDSCFDLWVDLLWSGQMNFWSKKKKRKYRLPILNLAR